MTRPTRKHNDGAGFAVLSVQEWNILRLACSGDQTNDEIAFAFGISSNTVKNHVTHILRKLGRKSMRGACTDFGELIGSNNKLEALRADQV